MLFLVSKGAFHGHNFQDFASKFDIQEHTTYIYIGTWGFFEIQEIVHFMIFFGKKSHFLCIFFTKKAIK